MYVIRKRGVVDTRQEATSIPDQEKLYADSTLHITDVKQLARYYISNKFIPDINSHDYTKLKYIEEFHDAFVDKFERGKAFKESGWWKRHVRCEPHHIFDYNGQTRIDLGHVIHASIDWVVAGKARNKDGQFRLKVLEEHSVNEVKTLLYKAFLETLDWLDKHTEVVDLDKSDEVVKREQEA